MTENDRSNAFELDRRKFLIAGGAGAAALGLAACGGGSSSGGSGASTSSPQSRAGTAAAGQDGTPKRGGTLRLGITGGSDTDTLDGQNMLNNPDFARCFALFEGLTGLDPQGKVYNRLAESIEPNKEGSTWTIKVRPNVVCHDGKKFGAKDVLYSLKRIKQKKYPGAISFGPIDLNASRVRDDLTLEVKFSKPYVIFPEGLSLVQNVMVPEGFNPKNPIGTGPYKYKSFTPADSSTFVRHDDYWQSGKPYLDTLTVVDIKDETAQVNALQSGQVDAITYLSSTSVNAAKGAGANVMISKTGAWGPFMMSNKTAPFSDNRVRQAIRLSIDRPQMMQQLFNGEGTLGNDVWGVFDPAFDGQPLPQRAQDIEKAKSLLKAAGHSSLTVELFTSNFAPGMQQAAEVLATQAKAAGINIKVTFQDGTRYFATSYLKVPFTQDYWPMQPYLVASQQAVVTGAPYNGTFQSNEKYDALYEQAVQTLDDNKRFELMREMRQYDYDQGGYIIPYLFPNVDAVSAKVKGIKSSVTGVALNSFDWPNIWMES
jgi:peptide/nickel transport system substrate-binding protein